MNLLLVTIQFERGSVWQFPARRLSRLMQKRGATYVSHGIYQVMATETAAELLEVICRELELTDRDFIGVFPMQASWAVRGSSQRGVHQPDWPSETLPSDEDVAKRS